MKTAIFLCLLTGCGSGLTEAKIDGLDTYIVKKNRVEQIEMSAQGLGIQDMPEWLIWRAKNKEAQDELRQALTGRDDEYIVMKSAKLTGISEAINVLRCQAISAIKIVKKELPEHDKIARDKGFGDNDEWVKARQMVAEKLVELSNATRYQDSIQLQKTFMDFLEINTNLMDVFYKLDRAAQSTTSPTNKK